MKTRAKYYTWIQSNENVFFIFLFCQPILFPKRGYLKWRNRKCSDIQS